MVDRTTTEPVAAPAPLPEVDYVGLHAILERNAFYAESHRNILLLCTLMILIIVECGAFAWHLQKTQPTPEYFPTNAEGGVLKLTDLDRPHMKKEEILNWATTAAVSTYAFTFTNYKQALQYNRANFTATGYRRFLQALADSNNLEAVLKKRLVVSAIATGPAEITAEGNVDGIYTWRIKLPMLVSYQSSLTDYKQAINVTMTIKRISNLESISGLGISQFIVESM